MKINKNYRQIYDCVHGSIHISNIASRIIDTYEFQRLRGLHQLGTCHYVYPSANHTRFEHSLGTYYLVDRILDAIIKNTPKKEINRCLELEEKLKNYYEKKGYKKDYHKLDSYICELIKIAGLCHDLGHGPFSHVFDDAFIPSVCNYYKDRNIEMELHENRSGRIITKIIKSDDVLKDIISDDEIEFIKNLINPKKEQIGFLYQIVSNNFNSIDVDKFDYLARDTYTIGLKFGFDYTRLVDDVRVIDNIICYPEQLYFALSSIFQTRYRLHKQVYNHKAVISVQLMINEIMILIDPIVRIYESINDIDLFCNLTDDYIFSTLRFLHTNINKYDEDEKVLIDEAYKIMKRINERDLYKFVRTIVADVKLDNKFDIIKKELSEEDFSKIMVHKTKIGFVSGEKNNPFDNLFFFKNKVPNKCFKIRKEQISYLIPNIYQEFLYMFFIDNYNDKDKTLELKLGKIIDDICT